MAGKEVGIFCDDSNLYYAYRRYGWRVDFRRLRKLLGSYCHIAFIYYYLAVPKQGDLDRRKTDKFAQNIRPFVEIKTKPLKYIMDGKRIRKGNVDVEIALDVVRSIDQLGVAIIMSGDSDFLELKKYVVKDKQKEIVFMGYEGNMAWELRQCRHVYLNRIRPFLELKNKPPATGGG